MDPTNEKSGPITASKLSEEPGQPNSSNDLSEDAVQTLAKSVDATPEDVIEAEEHAKSLSLEDTRKLAESLIYFHENDPNFNPESIVRLSDFLQHSEAFQDPELHASYISRVKIEVALLTFNSPYTEVRAVVSNKDDVSAPAGTLRAWTIGLLFVAIQSFVNQFFSLRQPLITLDATVVQLLSFPLGKAWEKLVPLGDFHLLGFRFTANPGQFNQKEHMLISIMANVAGTAPYGRFIVFTTWLEKYFNLPFASSFGFQICVTVSYI
ncbi:hypothetical protein NW762_010627 [Fusarium torreyae]|uniref:Uncharacterized protein n=1 Tax=Fusarium torreyae TaxID=1237075 RepID=A0A9W8RVN0_9HYPO|nr:hypothetical protein NW762_010627 [Fusarium torreyae]